MTRLVEVVGAGAHGYRPIALSDWALADMARQGLRLVDAGEDVWPKWAGYYCVTSGCVDDRYDSNSQCIDCGEALVYVTDS